MAMTVGVTEGSAVVATIIPSVGTAGSFLSQAVSLDAGTGRRIVADINLGALGASSTIDAKLQWSATSGGSYATITGTAMVQDVTASRVNTIEATIEKIVANYPLAKYIKLSVVIGTAATPMSATIRSYDNNTLPIANGASQGTITVYAG